jgi:hypothetical protein
MVMMVTALRDATSIWPSSMAVSVFLICRVAAEVLDGAIGPDHAVAGLYETSLIMNSDNFLMIN